MPSGVTQTGLDELLANFNRLDQDMHVKIITGAVRDATNIITEAVAAATPVNTEDFASGTSLPPGAMKSDVHTRISRKPDPGTVAGLCEFGNLTYFVADWVEYGHDQVKGGRHDKKSGRGSGTVSGHVPAHPFIRPAFEAVADAAQEEFVLSVSKRVAAAIKKVK